MVTDPSLFSVLDRVNSSSVASINLIYTDKRQLFIFLVAPRDRPIRPVKRGLAERNTVS